MNPLFLKKGIWTRIWSIPYSFKTFYTVFIFFWYSLNKIENYFLCFGPYYNLIIKLFAFYSLTISNMQANL